MNCQDCERLAPARCGIHRALTDPAMTIVMPPELRGRCECDTCARNFPAPDSERIARALA